MYHFLNIVFSPFSFYLKYSSLFLTLPQNSDMSPVGARLGGKYSDKWNTALSFPHRFTGGIQWPESTHGHRHGLSGCNVCSS